MAQITISFNGTATDLNDFCDQYKYQAEIPDPEDSDKTIPNPESKTAFFKRVVQEFVWSSVKSRRATKAADAARDAEVDKTVNF